jgi:hypothetical protein
MSVREENSLGQVLTRTLSGWNAERTPAYMFKASPLAQDRAIENGAL